MDLLLDAICVVDARGCFVFVSAAGERIFGYAPAEMIGRPMTDFVFHADRARTLQAVDEMMKGQPQPYFENRYVRKDGQIVHIMWSARWSAADQVRVAVARDVTERKHADAMQAALYAISEAAHAAEDLVALFEQVHQIIGGLMPADNFFIALYDQ
ncbi:MAG: diguanylate cyclase, partial [Betaproteobacteria bacterium HGW-Betaproteobacteria-17]